LFLTPSEAVLALREFPGQGKRGQATDWRGFSSAQPIVTTLRLALVGGNRDARLTGLDELPGKSNYFIGQEPKKWLTHLPNYAQVEAESVYRGINVVYHGRQRELEEDFLVAPGADPRAITIGIAGAKKIFINDAGELVLETATSEVRLRKPVVYQLAAGERREIAGGYRLEGMNRVGFAIGPYDTSGALVIDPVLNYSTYLGGSGLEGGNGMAIDSAGNAYVTGFTTSIDFPSASSSTIQRSIGGGGEDAFVAKINAAGSALVYSTYLGGNGSDAGTGIAVDSAGNAYVTGQTGSTGFPGTSTSTIQPALNGSEDAFVAKIIQEIPFSSFTAKLTILAGPPPGFDLNSSFTLGAGGSINPLTQPVTLVVGTYSVTIPPGSFIQLQNGKKAGSYVFSGTINGVSLSIQIVTLGGSSYQFKVTAQPVDLTKLPNPVALTITIGNNTGTMPALATFQ